MTFKIWVDADACPKVIKEILFRAATRTKTPVILVANNFIPTPSEKLVQFLQVPKGFDVADHEIVNRTNVNDLAITADIPLASELIGKGVQVLNPRGEVYTKENIGPRLNLRDFMDTMRSSGIQTKGPEPISASDRQLFANALDTILRKQIKFSSMNYVIKRE
ncbi:MAG: YaiI/YqxD family protein [Gammaproteobacteria bacterium TMED1]|nr:MAG: YaiI/YqxD family protein [Gammaproteobacteria bacterium TMED1]